MNAAWYWRRLRRMAPSEIAGRARDALLRRVWRQWWLLDRIPKPGLKAASGASFPGASRAGEFGELSVAARENLLRAADDLLEGRWSVFGRLQPRFGAQPDWFVDANSGRRAPADDFSFDIPYRDEGRVGNIKYIWEPSRHHHLTVLATAYAVSGDERYARRIAEHLHSWWRENPFLTGPHWISGIEIGIRLISWVWTRRLLDGWPEAGTLFEKNPQFVEQLYRHQYWLSRLPSRGSSANNHLVAEAAGQFVAASAFPIFRESARWQSQAAQVLEREAVAQTYPSGLNRELATEYQGLVLELFLAAAIEGELARRPLGPVVWERIRAMTDALASILDAAARPPRQGDGDDASGLLLDAPDFNRWQALLSTGRTLFGELPWWPAVPDCDLRTHIWTRGIVAPPLPQPRPSARIGLFADAGQAFLRKTAPGKEIWCRCDHGPLGFLSIAAHGHADALSIELRVNGVNILADPGTYCYHGERDWRRYFRSTVGHNTLELLAEDQSISGGPFLWTGHAQSRLVNTSGIEESASSAKWEAEHSGYAERGGPLHRRTVVFDRKNSMFTITDEVRGGGLDKVPARLAFHLGPSVECELSSAFAKLTWHGGNGRLDLPDEMNWSIHRGETNPPLGWYSKSFGEREPSVTLIGAGKLARNSRVVTRLKIS